MKWVISLLVSIMLICAQDSYAAKKRIAVLDFEDTAISVQSAANQQMAMLMAMMRRQPAETPRDRKIGKTVANILVNELVKDGTFTIIERNQLDKIFSEQKLSVSGTMDPSSAVKIGKLLGVTAVVTGSVNQFTVDTKTTGALGIGITTNTGRVAVTAKIIDTSTGEILFSAEGSGHEESKGIQVGGFFNTSDAGFENSLLGIATKKALSVVLAEINKQQATFKDPVISGSIVYIDDGAKTILTDLGKESGIENGQKLYILRMIKEIKNPRTGEVIKVINDNVAEVQILSVDKKSSTTTCVSGRCNELKVGDNVSSSFAQ